MMNTPDGTQTSSPACWEGWGIEKKKPQNAPHGLQERHSPTTDHALRGAGGVYTRRVADARLWSSMSPVQQEAALEISAAFELIGQGLGYTASNWEKIPGTRGNTATEGREKILGLYSDWARRCKAAGVSHSLVIDILIYGFSCRALDRDRRARTGHARGNLLRGLDLYCALRGWPVP